LKVEVLGVWFDDVKGGKRTGRITISVANLSVELVDRLAISVTLKQDHVGPIYTVEHTYDVHVEPGDFEEVDVVLGDVPLEEWHAGICTEVAVIASRRVNRRLPTYVLPESSTGVCAIEDAFALARDITVKRIDISLSRNLLRNRGWARVLYIIRNDSGISYSSLHLVTRFYSISGELLGEGTDAVSLEAHVSSRITAKVILRQPRGLGATRFEAEFEGFENIGQGSSAYRGVEGAPGQRDVPSETWEGEEVTGAYWVHRTPE
jgi:hypothetical protein